MYGEWRQELKTQFDPRGHDCSLTVITTALLLRRDELIAQ